MTMTDDKMAEIKKLCDAATPGPWDRRHPHEIRAAREAVAEAALEAVPLLLGMVEALRRERDEAKQAEAQIAEERGVALALVELRTRELDEAKLDVARLKRDAWAASAYLGAAMDNDPAGAALAQQVATLKGERDEADRSAGAAKRELEALEEQERRRDHWMREQKEALGYDLNVSFDDVWADVLRQRDDARASEARLREALAFYANPEIYKPHPFGPHFDSPDKSFAARAALAASERGS